MLRCRVTGSAGRQRSPITALHAWDHQSLHMLSVFGGDVQGHKSYDVQVTLVLVGKACRYVLAR